MTLALKPRLLALIAAAVTIAAMSLNAPAMGAAPATSTGTGPGAHAMGIRNPNNVGQGIGPTDVDYNKGPVMHTTTTYAIYWIPRGYSVSRTYESLINRYFTDVGGSGLYNNNTQYYDQTGPILNSSTFGGSWEDTTTPYPNDCVDPLTPVCVSASAVVTEIQHALRVNGWAPGLDHLFFLYVASGVGDCAGIAITGAECAFTAFCAWHSAYPMSGPNGNTDLVYAFIPYGGYDLAVCGAGVYPNGDPAADAAINATSHEQMEAVTDPTIYAWFDATKTGLVEIGDLCAWTFGPALNATGADAVWNGHNYYVQREWDNTAANCVMTGP